MRKEIQKRLLLVHVVLLMFGISSCNFSEAYKLTQATHRLHEQLKQSKFKDIYRQTAPSLRSNMSEEEFVTKLREIKSRLGDINTIEKADYGIEKRTKLQGSTIFAESHKVTGTNTDCTELTHWVMDDGEILLYGYECFLTDN